MTDIETLSELQAGDTFTIGLLTLAYQLAEPDEFAELAEYGGSLSVGMGELVFEPDEDDPSNPYVDLHMGGQVAAMDGETVKILENDVDDSKMTLLNEDGVVPAEFELDYETLAICMY